MPARRRSDRVPERTCAQCGTKGPKGTFIRIAGDPGRGFDPDPAGLKPGRGIYLCRGEQCVKGFARRLGTPRGGARWKMGASGAVLADRLLDWWRHEAK
ncbi:MAG: YlxR family protein [Deltaproteobacteria bacterium]|nr:YlxR family protein [Deltaproteobacteria bacterium]